MRRVLVTGSRDWPSKDAVAFALLNEWAKGEFILVHGGCPTGADHFARLHAEAYGIAQEIHLAQWAKYGKGAGPFRNAQMVALGADVCHAFPIGPSMGTRGCMALAALSGIPVVNHDPEVMP